jgi:hypothetical protein
MLILSRYTDEAQKKTQGQGNNLETVEDRAQPEERGLPRGTFGQGAERAFRFYLLGTEGGGLESCPCPNSQRNLKNDYQACYGKNHVHRYPLEYFVRNWEHLDYWKTISLVAAWPTPTLAS